MPRTARVELAGGIHHVTARGNRKQAIFRDDRDRWSLLRELRLAAAKYGWIALTHCLMPNHVHLVIETPEPTLGLGMRQLIGRYAQAFNRRHETSGHLFQGRYGSVLVRSDEQLAQLLRYVALNPVVAGLCDDPARWRWSSHRALLGGGGPDSRTRGRVESLLKPWGGEPGSRYAGLFDPRHPVAVRFAAESPWTYRPPLEELLRRSDLDEAMRAARRHGYRLAEIASVLGVDASTVSRRTRRRSGAG